MASNLIAWNVARGVQLYRYPHDVEVVNNTIVWNGRAGIQFAASTESSLARWNILAFKRTDGCPQLLARRAAQSGHGEPGLGERSGRLRGREQ